MKYVFILGRNPELSRAELFSYLDTRRIKFNEFFYSNNSLILEFKQDLVLDINLFGGLLGFGRLIEFPREKDLSEYLKNNEFVQLDRFTYSVRGNLDSSLFSEKFKIERKKAQIRNFGKKLKFQSGEQSFLPRADVEIFAAFYKSVFLLGLIEQKFCSDLIEKRDMKKPVRRESLAISPRLAKILINLSGAKEGDLVLDPFCGVGGIIQEAVLMGINCVGIDRDSDAIEGARENLNWLKKEYLFSASYKLFNSNSLTAENKQYNSIIAESSLGNLLRRRLNRKQARIYLDDFKTQIIPLLRRFKEIKKKESRIAITFPCFDDLQISKEEICNSTGLKIYSREGVSFPIIEKRDKQFVNRQIWVFV